MAILSIRVGVDSYDVPDIRSPRNSRRQKITSSIFSPAEEENFVLTYGPQCNSFSSTTMSHFRQI